MLEAISGNEAAKLALAPYGTTTITSADGVVTGDFFGVQFEEDSVLASLVLDGNSSGADKLVAVATHAAGIRLWKVKSIALTSGTATLFKVS